MGWNSRKAKNKYNERATKNDYSLTTNQMLRVHKLHAHSYTRCAQNKVTRYYVGLSNYSMFQHPRGKIKNYTEAGDTV